MEILCSFYLTLRNECIKHCIDVGEAREICRKNVGPINWRALFSVYPSEG